MNKPHWISPFFILVVKNKEGEEGTGLKEKGAK